MNKNILDYKGSMIPPKYHHNQKIHGGKVQHRQYINDHWTYGVFIDKIGMIWFNN